MLKEDISKAIVTVPDYPIPGVQFRDITSLLADSELHRAAVKDLITWAAGISFSAIVGIESRGFLFAAPIALELNLPLVLARKPGKLPRTTMTKEYELEYGRSSINITVGTIPLGGDVLVVDDIIATGGTALATAELCKEMGAEGVAIAALANLEGLGGRRRLQQAGYLVYNTVEL